MTDTVRISVAMATYNGARHLPAQLASIAAQTRLPDELVVGDDGSADGTADLIADFARRVPFEVRFTRNAERLGSTPNFVATLQRCRGEIALLSDQDDVWAPARVERSVAALDAEPAAAYAFSDGELMDDAGAAIPGRLWQKAFFGVRGRERFSRRRGAEVLLRTNCVTGATMAIRLDRLAAALPVPAGWVHDAWLAFLLEVQYGAVAIPEPLVRYRLHGAQQIGVLRMTPSAVVAVARRHDAAFLRREARNFRALAARLAALSIAAAPDLARRAADKAEFLERRAAFRDAPLRATGALFRALVGGDYAAFGLGAKQAGFDVLGAVVSIVSGGRGTPAPGEDAAPRGSTR